MRFADPRNCSASKSRTFETCAPNPCNRSVDHIPHQIRIAIALWRCLRVRACVRAAASRLADSPRLDSGCFSSFFFFKAASLGTPFLSLPNAQNFVAKKKPDCGSSTQPNFGSELNKTPRLVPLIDGCNGRHPIVRKRTNTLQPRKCPPRSVATHVSNARLIRTHIYIYSSLVHWRLKHLGAGG